MEPYFPVFVDLSIQSCDTPTKTAVPMIHRTSKWALVNYHWGVFLMSKSTPATRGTKEGDDFLKFTHKLTHIHKDNVQKNVSQASYSFIALKNVSQ